jgi:hypothetical protein
MSIIFAKETMGLSLTTAAPDHLEIFLSESENHLNAHKNLCG